MYALDADEPIRLPDPPPEPQRPPLPVLAAIAPVIGAVVLWLITGSPFALWFALLGPLLAIASMLDGKRGVRRQRRRAAVEQRQALEEACAELDRRHDVERTRAWGRTPGVAGYLHDPSEIWRSVPGRSGTLVVGAGAGPSAVRVTGGDDADAAGGLRRRARVLEAAPVTIDPTVGVAVVGPAVATAAVVRALVLQLCLSHPPGAVRLAAVPEWLVAAPHAARADGALVQVVGAGSAPAEHADIVVVQVEAGEPPPPRCGAVLTLGDAGRARLDHAGSTLEVDVEALSVAQAHRISQVLAVRAKASLRQGEDRSVTIDELQAAPAPGALGAVIGATDGSPVAVDLVEDGPHAIVIGTTGSGKSELLTTWVVSLARRRSPDEVSFLLVDFKGGRTFDHLTALPHVTGVLTDLDEAAALRAVESLRAEIRLRERVLGDAGARDVAEAEGALGRLVIVVDEYAALVAAHPSLHEIFADVAARGRALGMHLVLASQRAAGVFRDALLANAPLRIALRVADAGDSRAVLGTAAAAELPGTREARGVALVRRPADDAPVRVRIATTATATVAGVAAGCTAPRARAPWLPALPAMIPLADLRARVAPGDAEEIVLGVADEPDRQAQPLVTLPATGLLIVGAAGTGRSAALRTIAAQATRAHVVPTDGEAGWDALEGIAVLARGTVVLIDDLDVLLSRWPEEHRAAALSELEARVREAHGRGIRMVIAVQRVTGGVGRIADLLPHRALLALASRADHVAAGGEGADHLDGVTPGRVRLGRRLVQFAWTDEGTPTPHRSADAPTASARPDGPRAFVLPPGPRGRALAAQHGCVAVDDPAAAEAPAVWGTPEMWLAQWPLLTRARAEASLIIDTACAGEYRTVTGRRELPPYAMPGAGRAWLAEPDEPARRIRIDG
ncbi:FtsK/SpoIIIE domain-containing protein [Microbacterium sp. bgisy189]|uniref:FtsK/SpoIIIE domain-containing protein n=1 Tax=Microbacterium sp. bgisy189 TaxID=3413798 RepID=UPI003EBD117C